MPPAKAPPAKAPAKAASKKGAPVISKGTPAPPRYKEGEEPPLPHFPITWTPIAACVETMDGNLNASKAAELVNASSTDFTITVVDAQEMADEEMFIDGSELGISLKAAKDAKQSVNTAQEQIVAAKDAVKSAINKERERLRFEKENVKKETENPMPGPAVSSKSTSKDQKGAAAGKGNKDKATAAASSKKKASVNKEVPVLDFKQELQRLKSSVAEAEQNLKNCENKVITTAANVGSMESTLERPYVTGRLYWCLGLGCNSLYISRLAEGTSIFRAVLNIVVKYVRPPDYPIDAPNDQSLQSNDSIIEFPAVQTPILVSELRALAYASKLNEPARRVAVVDVYYNKVFGQTNDNEQKQADVKKPKDKKVEKKGNKVEEQGSVPYDDIVKPFSEACRTLFAQVKEYDIMDKNSQPVSVPLAVSEKDVDMRYYSQLLGSISPVLTTVPVVLYCMVEQVTNYILPESRQILDDRDTTRKCINDFLQKALGRLGCSRSGISGSGSAATSTLSGDYSEAAVVGHCPTLDAFSTPSGDNRLIVVHEYDTLGKLAATILKEKLETRASALFEKAVDVIAAEKRMLQLLPVPGSGRRGMPKDAALPYSKRKALLTALERLGGSSFSAIQRYRKLRNFADMLQVNEEGCRNDDLGCIEKVVSVCVEEAISKSDSVICRHHLEYFPDGLLADIYSKAKLFLPYEKTMYDADEDCVLAAVFAPKGLRLWEGNVPTQVPFGDFCGYVDADRLPRTPHFAYDLERSKSIIVERKWVLPTKNALVCCGLPSVKKLRTKPQISLYKDGNAILLRAAEDKKTPNHVLACLKDGLVVYFSTEKNGKATLQIRDTSGRSFELTSSGVAWMSPSDVQTEKCSGGSRSQGLPHVESIIEAESMPPAGTEANSSGSVFSNCSSSIATILKSEHGEAERYRCLLSSGTILCQKENGEHKILFRNGNVSEFKRDCKGNQSWITTNNKGECLAQVFLAKQLEVPVEEKSVSEKGSKKADVKKKPEKGGKKSETSNESKVSSKKQGSVSELPEVNPPAEQATLPTFLPLPNKKLAMFSDPESGSTICTREDLVVIVTSPDKSSSLVHHADGTEIFNDLVSVDTAIRGNDSEVEVHESADASTGNDIEKVEEQGLGDSKRPDGNWSQEPGTCSVEPSQPCLKNSMWQVTKKGFPSVSGLEGQWLEVKFSSSLGDYSAKWISESAMLRLSMPCGSILYSDGDRIIFKPSPDVDENNGGDQDATHAKDLDALDSWESKHFHLGDEDYDANTLLNTNGQYIFNLRNESFCYTDSIGNGFIASGGSYVDFISFGKVLKTCNETSTETATYSHLDSFFSTLPRSPSPRLFVMFEGGCGFEILDEAMFSRYASSKRNAKNCHDASDIFDGIEDVIECHQVSDRFQGQEDVTFHVFITLNEKHQDHVYSSCQRSSRTARSPFFSTNDIGDDVVDPSLPRVVVPPKAPSALQDCTVATLMYREIYEYPLPLDAVQAVDLQRYEGIHEAMLQAIKSTENAHFQEFSETQEKEFSENQEVTDRIQMDLAEKKLEDARMWFRMEQQYVEKVIVSVAEKEAQRVEEIARKECEERATKQEEWLKYFLSKKHITCMHKPRDRLQTEGPFKPISNMLLQYFKCEEGLRAILTKYQSGDRVKARRVSTSAASSRPRQLAKATRAETEGTKTKLASQPLMKVEHVATENNMTCMENLRWDANKSYILDKAATSLCLRTASMALIRQRRPAIERPQFAINPSLIDFKKIEIGKEAMQAATISNINYEASRIRIKSLENSLKITYEHGLVAAGMSRKLNIWFYPSKIGKFGGMVQVETEFDVFLLHVVAEVVDKHKLS